MKKIAILVISLLCFMTTAATAEPMSVLSSDIKSEDITSGDNNIELLEGASGCNAGIGGLGILAIGMLFIKIRRDTGSD